MNKNNKQSTQQGFPFGLNPSHVSKTLPEPSSSKEEFEKLYDTILSDASQIVLAKNLIFDATIFAEYYNTKLAFNTNAKRAMRKMIQQGTIIAFINGKYIAQDGKIVHLDKKACIKMVQQTNMFAHKPVKAVTVAKQTKIQVVQGDCLRATLLLKAKYNPLCLVMASTSHPGGGYEKGSGAQEEQMCRRTNLYMCLQDCYHMAPSRSWTYPLPEFGGIYVPECYVIRGTEQDGYPFLSVPQHVSMVAVSAYHSPPVDEQLRMDGKMCNKIKKKMQCMIQAAVDHGHDALVLSAFGCGAYQNPAAHTAELFQQVLNQECKGMLSYVVFAIYDDQNAKQNMVNTEGNIAPFHRVFHGKNTPILNMDQFIPD